MARSSLLQNVILYQWWKPVLFFIILIIGLWQIKWLPYYSKAFIAADTHSIGDPIFSQIDNSSFRAAWDYTVLYFCAIWKAALFGLLLGSLIQVLIPRNYLLKTLGRSHFLGAVFGIGFALPSMMCSCCAAPVVMGMRRQGATMGSALAFWIANPLLNPATLIFMGFVIGWQFVLIRLVAAIIVVFVIAIVVQKLIKEPSLPFATIETVLANSQSDFLLDWVKTFWSLFWNVVPIYILIVLLLGASSVWLLPHTHIVDNSLFWIVVIAIMGCLFVIPTAAEVPIVQGMIVAGMGIAPALTLLITLPAVSLPSLIILRKVFPRHALWLTGALVILCGVIVGKIGAIYLNLISV